MDKQSNKARFKQYFLVVTRCQQPCQRVVAFWGLLAAIQLEVGLFPTIVDSLAVDVMSVEVLVRFVVTTTS